MFAAHDQVREDLDHLLLRQSGVVSRAQLRDLGLAPHDVRRALRRRELVVIHPGVCLTHTGDPTWLQRAWGGVLALWPAALCRESALRAEQSRMSEIDDGPIHIAVDRGRSPAPPRGIRLHRVTDFSGKVRWAAGPPRVWVEEAVLDVAADARDELRTIAALADAVQSRLTTADRLVESLSRRSRIARRQLLTDVLADVANGTCSVLEHAYLTRVERPHGLPKAGRQVQESARGSVYRDVVYPEQDTYVELDGRLFHDNAAARDLDLACTNRSARYAGAAG